MITMMIGVRDPEQNIRVRKTHNHNIFYAILATKIVSFYQDRLGTNIGKLCTQNERCGFRRRLNKAICCPHACFATYAGGSGIQFVNNHCEGSFVFLQVRPPNPHFSDFPLRNVNFQTSMSLPRQARDKKKDRF